MAKIKIKEVISYLDLDFKKALKDTVDAVSPNNNMSKDKLFKAFEREVSKKFKTWEQVPDQHVNND